MPRRFATRACLAQLLAALLLVVPACGSGSAPAVPSTPFVAALPDDTPGGGGTGDTTPPPSSTLAPLFEADAWVHERTAFFGSFPSDTVVHGLTAFTNDADQIEAGGASIVPLDVSGPVPRASDDLLPVTLTAADLVDSRGGSADLSNPVGFGFFLNDIEIVSEDLAFVLVNAGGSDSAPTLSNVVAFDPSAGTVLQTVDLAHRHPGGSLGDSAGSPIPQGGFLQSGAEALRYVRTGVKSGRLYVAMTNLVFGAPSYGTVKYPGTVQVYDVRLDALDPIAPRPSGGLSTQTILLDAYNPVALQLLVADGGKKRLLVTVAGTTGYDDTFALVPRTPASVEVFDALQAAYLGRFEMGLAGLSATRPALGRDLAGHRIGFYPSAVTGEVYLLRLDGLFEDPIAPDALQVLRGPENGIPVAPEDAGGPGGNVTSVAILGGGRWLAVSGFGDLFAFPEAKPGRLYLLRLPPDVLTGAGFGTNYVPGWTRLEVLPGRALGTLVRLPPGQGRPDIVVGVSGSIDLATFGGTTPASLGALWLRGLGD